MVRSMAGDRRIIACVLAVLVLLAMSWGAARAEAAADEASVTIATDTGEEALFSSVRLLPGRIESTCLSVATAHAQYGEVVAVTAQDVSGALATRLLVTVDRGTGGGGGSCVGFSGSPVFSGTLATLGSSLTNGGVDTGWYAERLTMQVFRITVTVPNDASVQGLTAAGRFTWLIRPGPNPPPPGQTPTKRPGPSRPTAPDSLPPAGPTSPADPQLTASDRESTGTPAGAPTSLRRPATPVPVTGSATDAPSVTEMQLLTPAPTEVVTGDATDDAGGGPGGNGPGGGDRPGAPATTIAAPLIPAADIEIETALPIALTRTLVSLGSEPQYPIAVVIVVLAFLLVQHGIDARDPKLAAAAATQRDNELSFEDPFAQRGQQPEPGTG